jgi:regulator of cell morphogenesis and NO signaling
MTQTKLASVLEEMTVNDVVQSYPETVVVFNDFGIEACCGGGVPVREAAVRDGASPEAVLDALVSAIEDA